MLALCAVCFCLGDMSDGVFSFFSRAPNDANAGEYSAPYSSHGGIIQSSSPPGSMHVEDLMYKYKSDKSRDDHGYTKLYNLIFSPIRLTVRNVTEVGIAAGQSLQAWYRYFPQAEIHGFDVNRPHEKVQANMDRLKPRVHTHIVNILGDGVSLEELGFLPESMDVIIEDGPHSRGTQEDFLVKLFPLLRPGGIYIIEDVGQQGTKYFHEKPSLLKNKTRHILETNDAIWVDASLGHRAWDEWVRRVGRMWVKDRVYHNSYLVVIQKRESPLRQPMQMNYKNGAMVAKGVVVEDGMEGL